MVPARSPRTRRIPTDIVLRDGPRASAPGAAVTACAPSTRTRLFVTGDANGHVRVAHMTTEKDHRRGIRAGGAPGPVRPARSEEGRRRRAVAAAAVAAIDLDGAYPERVAGVALRSRSGTRATPGPKHVWQSSSGTRRLRAQARPHAADLRHAQGDVLLDALRRADRAARGDLHERVPAAARVARAGQVRRSR